MRLLLLLQRLPVAVLALLLWCGFAAAQEPAEPLPGIPGSGRIMEQFGVPAEPAGRETAPETAPEAAPAKPLEHPHGSLVQPLSPLGGKLLSGLQEAATGFVLSIREDLAAGRATLRRLRGLGSIDREEVASVLRVLGPPLVVSLAVAVLGRFALRPVFRRLGRAASGRGPLGIAALALVKILLDLALILLATLAAAATTSGDIDDAENYLVLDFIIGFLVAGWLIVVLRAIFSPAVPELRPLPMDDAAARYWTWRLGAVVALIAFGEIVVPPLLTEIATPISARATTVAIYVIALIYLMYLVVVNRNAPREHFERSAAERDQIWPIVLALVVRYWHWAALACLLFLLHQVVTSGAAGVPVLIAVAEVAGALAVAVLASRLLDQFAARGVRLSEPVRRAMPGVEARLADFVPPFVRTLRTLLVALWIGFVLQALGVLRLGDWLERRFGLDIVGAAASLLAIVLVGFGAWLAISTWIEYRLTPHGGRVPTAREHTLLSLLRNAAAIVILLVGLYYALLGVGISLAPLLASAGVIALAISWGSQKLVQDIITGLFIQLENAINVGDVVEAGGKIGVVEKLTIRSVSLRDVEGVYHLIPFSSVDAVSNHMKGFSYHVADISVAYGADIDVAKAAMLAAYDELAENPDWSWRLLGEIEWFGVQALADSAVILRARLKTRPGEQWAIGRAYAEAAKKRLDAAGIEIPFPQRKLWLATATDADRLPGRLEPTRQTRAAGAPTDAGEGHDGDEP